MLNRKCLILVMAAGFVGSAMIAGAGVTPDTAASVIVGHGIPGGEIGQPTKFPVDVAVDGSCVLPAFGFGDFAGPIPFEPGTYAIAISPANPGEPCANDAAIAADVTFETGENVTLLAHLDAAGTPVATKFSNDLSPLPKGKSRVVVRHAAAADAVDVVVRRARPLGPSTTVEDLANGEQAGDEMRPGKWLTTIFASGTQDAVFGPEAILVRPFQALFVHAVGGSELKLIAFPMHTMPQGPQEQELPPVPSAKPDDSPAKTSSFGFR